MKKIYLIFVLLIMALCLMSCNQEQKRLEEWAWNMTRDEEILQQYDFCLGTIKERSNVDDGYTYAIEVKNEIGLIKSNKLFSVGDVVLLVEVQENKSILIDLD